MRINSLLVVAVSGAVALTACVPAGSYNPNDPNQRTRSGAIIGALGGAALGAAVLYLVFHHLGWAKLFDAYPDVVRSGAWSEATRWLTSYGVASLLLIAALPLPLTPALMFAAISRLPVAEVLLALWIGKLAKYLVYAWMSARFPERLLRLGRRRSEGGAR